MKKPYVLIVIFVLLAISIYPLNAQEFTYNDFDFTINDDDETVTLLGHIDGFAASGELNIPSVAYWYGNGYTVTVIDNQAFYYNTGFEGPLVIPNTIREIGDLAFYPCTGFTSLTLPNSLTNIGDFAFSGCTGLTEISILATTPPIIGEDPFEDCVCSTLLVPCGYVEAYNNTAWSTQFETIIQDCEAVSEFEESSVSVYPNPTHKFIKIEAQDIQNISIYNVLEKKVFESEVNGNAFEYDFGKHENGVYLIIVYTVNDITYKRIIVQNL